MPDPRVVCWFSAGGPSAVAAKLAIAEHGHARTVVAYINPGSEHPDNLRFVGDVERWLDHPVELLASDRYTDTWDVWEKRRFLGGQRGALCTVELKKRVRYAYQLPDDRHVFGFTADEGHRVARFRDENPGVELLAPLVDRGLRREDCLAILNRAGIELPAMYRLGYHNANCVGCPKGGMGYWNKVRVDFPEVFDRMARLERELGHSILGERVGGRRSPKTAVWLDELDPDRGDYPSEVSTECGLLCAIAETELEAPRRA